jgi:amino acid permease
MSSLEGQKELDVEKAVAKNIDFNSLHSGTSAPKTSDADDLHFDERENDGVQRRLKQRHVQMYVDPLSFIHVAYPLAPILSGLP